MRNGTAYGTTIGEGPAFGIGELASMFGVTQRAIRFYEDQGLLAPKRIGKTRIFGDRDRVRLDFILRGKRLGFSLAEIRDWLDLYDVDNGARRQYEALLEGSRKKITELERQRDDLEETLRELKSIEALAREKLGNAAGDDRQQDGHRPERRVASGQRG
ncbi:MAG: MerR family DNA-binding transcriptional regulator [Alphaproteobacteria bacterium]|nr:MerR family DNA-binding transcriptional regulator [Alphaproteobacteria bacterium]